MTIECLDQVVRQDLNAFTIRAFHTLAPNDQYHHNWHIEAIAHQLTECLEGRTKRLLITMPPRNLKSICGSAAFPAFALGHNPSLKFVCASYAQDLADMHARDCRTIIQSDWYQRAFPNTILSPHKNTASEFETTARGQRLSTSVGGTLTGRGGNFLIVDDPLKAADAASEVERKRVIKWFKDTLLSRLDDKAEGVIIVIMQRLHADDLAGYLIEQGGWTHLDLAAIAKADQYIRIDSDKIHHRRKGEVLHPARESAETLAAIRKEMGTANFSAQYQQDPVPAEGNLVKLSWFNRYDGVPLIKEPNIVQSWDTASKTSELNDYSVCTTWLVLPDHWYYLIDVFRDRLEFPDLKKQVLRLRDRFSARTVLIEDKGSGISLIQDLRAERKLRPIACKPEGDKDMRFRGHTATLEAGRVMLPTSARWLAQFEAEILAFPNGRHDDQVDSVSQILTWLKEKGRHEFGQKELRGLF